MAHPYHHAISSAKKWGGTPEDYLPIHNWFDESKAHIADIRHRALRHHSEGIFLAEKIFGITITISTGRKVPVRFIGEQHVLEDFGFIPSLTQFLSKIKIEPWMRGNKNFETPDDVCENKKLEVGKELVKRTKHFNKILKNQLPKRKIKKCR